MSIQRLSNPNEEPIFDQRLLNNKNPTAGKNLISFNQNFNNQPKDWKELVQKRIEAKTRIKKVNLNFGHFVKNIVILISFQDNQGNSY